MPKLTDKPIFKQLVTLTDYLIRANDVDPDYPVLHCYSEDQHLPKDQRKFLTFLFSIVDNSTLAISFFEKMNGNYSLKSITKFAQWWNAHAKEFHYGKERQRNFGNTIGALQAYARAPDWPILKSKDRYKNYRKLEKAVSAVKYVGPLTGFDWMELAQRSLGEPIAPPHITTILTGCFGPVHATEIFFPSKQGSVPKRTYLAGLESKARIISDAVAKEWKSVPDYSLMESSLCKFQKWKDGRYYVGWEIDEQWGEVCDYALKAKTNKYFKLFKKLRSKCFLPQWLRENINDDIETGVSYTKIKPRHLVEHMHRVYSGDIDLSKRGKGHLQNFFTGTKEV